MHFFDPLLDILFPRFCAGCQTFGTYLCSDCAKNIRLIKLPLCPGCMETVAALGVHSRCTQKTHLDGLLVVARFDGILKDMIAGIKYQGYFAYTDSLTPLLAHKLLTSRLQPKVLVPIPLHAQKLHIRGFNQSTLLAQQVSRMTAIPMTDQLLLKRKATPSQVKLKREERLQNLRDAFHITVKLKKTDTVLLIDDVVTTGATFSVAAQTLKKAGAGKVFGLALAHGH
jgi:competence protein ComFC